MVYVTGDTHGNVERFKEKNLKRLKKGDTLLICGDFGFLWDDSRQERNAIKKLASLRYNVAFVDGCHENFDLLNSKPVDTWNGGKVHVIAKGVFHLMRGQVYTIDGLKIFTFGGGHSEDVEIRKQSKSWYPQEEPTPADVEEGIKNVELAEHKFDYIITHEPPFSIKKCMSVELSHRLECDTLFEQIKETSKFEHWFFGKYHMNKFIPPKFSALFDEVVPLE